MVTMAEHGFHLFVVAFALFTCISFAQDETHASPTPLVSQFWTTALPPSSMETALEMETTGVPMESSTMAIEPTSISQFTPELAPLMTTISKNGKPFVVPLFTLRRTVPTTVPVKSAFTESSMEELYTTESPITLGEEPFPLEEPVTEEPFPLEEPVTEEPFPLEEPVTEEPFPLEEPVTEEPFPLEEPVTEEPFPLEEPVTEEPFPLEEPVTEEPFPLEEPVTEEPFPTVVPVTEEPFTEEPFPTEEPFTEEPFPTEEPVTEEVPVTVTAEPFPTEEPFTEEPFPTEEPVTEEVPVTVTAEPFPTEEPFPMEEPVTEEVPVTVTAVPVTEEPFPTAVPVTEEPFTEEPFPTEEPFTEEPVTEEVPVTVTAEPFPTEEPITVTEIPVTKPSTTVITASTPATEPTPTNLTMGNYTIARGGGGLCVKAQMALRIRITYSTVYRKKSNGTFIIQPGETVATGGCSNSTATVHLKFEEGVVFFRFQKNVTLGLVYVSTIAFELTHPFIDADPEQGTYRAKNESLQMFSAAVRHSYACSSQSVSMGPGLHLDVSQIKMQALEFDGNEFGPEDLCPGDWDHQIVLVVGVLALVVVVIVIAVCVLWRRRRLDGYQPL